MPAVLLASDEPRAIRVGYLTSNPSEERTFVDQLRKSLSAAGWIEGRNLQLFSRYATGVPPKYEVAAKALMALKPDLIFASGAPALRAQFKISQSIPLLTTDFSSDPIGLGYAVSYARPGKNVTGVFLDAPQFAGKWFDILHSLVPNMKRVAVLWHPETGTMHLKATQQVAEKLKIRLQVHEVRSLHDAEAALTSLKGRQQAVVILPSPVAFAFSSQLADLALKLRLPATSMAKGFAESGGLVNYGPNLAELNKRAFALGVRILKGEKPGDLPIETPARFDFLINTGTAAKLGIKVPDHLLMGAELVDR